MFGTVNLTLPVLDQDGLPEVINEIDRTKVILTKGQLQRLLDVVVHVVEGRLDDTNLDELIELTDELGLATDQSERLDDELDDKNNQQIIKDEIRNENPNWRR